MARLSQLYRSRALACAAAAIALIAPCSTSYAAEWAEFALISSTLGVSGSRLCVGEDSRGALGCPSYAPSLTTAGDISVTGNLSASKFLGDGSGLTGISTTSATVTTGLSGSLVFRDENGYLKARDTISVSSTTGSVGIGAGAPVSIGNNSLYVDNQISTGSNIASFGNLNLINTSFATIGWSGARELITGNPGATNHYLSFTTSGTEALRIVSSGFVGIGTTAPSGSLHVQTSSTAPFTIGNTDYPANYLKTYLSGNSNATVLTNGTFIYQHSSSGAFILSNGTGYAKFAAPTNVPSLIIGPNVSTLTASATIHAIGSLLVASATGVSTPALYVSSTNGFVGIGTLTPSTSLHSTGSIRIADGGEACDINRKGALKYSSSEFYVCRNGTTWESLSSVASTGVSDRIVSSSANITAGNGSGTISFTTGGVSGTAYLDTTGRLIASGVSTTGGISGSTGYFGGDAEVRGNISTSIVKLADNPADACTMANIGAIKSISGRLYVCRKNP